MILGVGNNLSDIQLSFEPFHIDLPPKMQNLPVKKLIAPFLKDPASEIIDIEQKVKRIT